jgi:hypothetical protein
MDDWVNVGLDPEEFVKAVPETGEHPEPVKDKANPDDE